MSEKPKLDITTGLIAGGLGILFSIAGAYLFYPEMLENTDKKLPENSASIEKDTKNNKVIYSVLKP